MTHCAPYTAQFKKCWLYEDKVQKSHIQIITKQEFCFLMDNCDFVLVSEQVAGGVILIFYTNIGFNIKFYTVES